MKEFNVSEIDSRSSSRIVGFKSNLSHLIYLVDTCTCVRENDEAESEVSLHSFPVLAASSKIDFLHLNYILSVISERLKRVHVSSNDFI